MNFKIKRALVLIFIVISLLLVVNSVNATDTYENNTIVDDSLSLANDVSIENLNNEISDDVITINSDDGTETEVTNSVAEVSNSNGKLSSTDDEDVLGGRFYINVVSDTPVVRPGDEVIFDVYVQNTGDTYTGVWDNEAWNNVLPINNWIDSNEFELMYIEPTDGWRQNYVNKTPQFTYYWDGSSYLIVKYKVWNWLQWYDLHYKVHLRAKDPGVPGEYGFKAQIYDTTYSGCDPNDECTAKVIVGNPSVNYTKTTSTPVVMKGERVCFDIILVNNGTLPYIPDIIISDWFDSGLIYDGYELMPDLNGNRWDQNYFGVGTWYDDMYGYRFMAGYHTYGNWTPGSSLHLKVYFNTTEVGVYNNSAHIYWKWKDWGPDETHEALEVWANASVIVAEPEFTVNKVASSNIVEVGDIINYNIAVTNTGLVNLTGVFVQDKNYSNGLRYLDYTDKDSWEFDGVDKWTFVGVLAPDESTSLLLSFEVTKAGLLINNVIAGNSLKNETHSSEADVEAEEPEENKTDGNPDGPEGSDEDEIPHDSENEDDTSDKSGDGSEEADNVSGETQDGIEVHAETSKSVMNATGNPLFVLLLCLIALGLIPSRGKK